MNPRGAESKADGKDDGKSARVLLGVRGMDTEESTAKVRAALLEVPGVVAVDVAGEQQLLVSYDPAEATVMDMIRAARRLGFLAGMV